MAMAIMGWPSYRYPEPDSAVSMGGASSAVAVAVICLFCPPLRMHTTNQMEELNWKVIARDVGQH